MPDSNVDQYAGDFRRRAEHLAAQQQHSSSFSEDDTRRVLHELQVHQIELELQNEALRETQAEAQEALNHIAELNRCMEQKIVERTSELVAARDAAEAANRAKSAFLSNMSHELRTPLNGVMGMVELALLRATDRQQIDWLEKAQSSAAHLLSVITDILDIASMEAAQTQIKPASFRLNQLIELLANVLAPAITKQGIEFHIDIPAELANRPVIGDAQRIGQILLNLAGNAVKFTAQGAVKVSVRVEAELPDGPLVLFEVRDSGIGIAAHDQKRLFRAFAQVDDNLSRHYEGTGLGLAICKHMVDLMGGQIGLQSVPGEGSTFWFSLPLGCSNENIPTGRAVEAQAAPSAAVELATQYVDASILVAEDNPVNQEIMRALLRCTGMRVDVASDGVEAVSMALDKNYDLIFMDLQMPRLNGIGAARTIRLDPRLRSTPIVALTASVFDQDHRDCLAAGMNDLLAKPIGRDVLYGMVLKWLRQGQSIQSAGA